MSATGPTRLPLHMDHVSVAVPDLAEAIRWFEARLGLRATLSPADPGRHSRVYLDRSYLEVSAREPVHEWGVPLFFLRFEDPAALKRHLTAAGIDYTFGRYEGVDGRWDDVELQAGTFPLPILVRRTHPPEIAAEWPPALAEPHRCGAQALDAVLVNVPGLDEAVEVYARLLGIEGTKVARDGRQVVLRLASGRVILEEGETPGVTGIVLSVASLGEAAGVIGPLQGSPVAWLHPSATHGLRLGFVAAAPSD